MQGLIHSRRNSARYAISLVAKLRTSVHTPSSAFIFYFTLSTVAKLSQSIMPPEFVFEELERERETELEKERHAVENDVPLKEQESNNETKDFIYRENSKVRFDVEAIEKHDVKARCEMSFAEVTNTWYQLSDFSG